MAGKETRENQEQDLGMEARKVKALEKIAMNLEALVIFCENLETEEWSERIQWYLGLFKKAYLDPKLPEEV